MNKDFGTDNPDDLIALVYLKWDEKNSEATSKEMLTMFSDDLAVTVASDCPNVQELAIFWEIPYLDKNVKFSYERKDKGMYIMDHVW